jgi:cell wall-associated NlpC family hydrolase
MARIKARLAKIVEKLTSNQTQLKKARKRYKANIALEGREKAKAVKAQEAADKVLHFGPNQDQVKGEAETRKADRCLHRAHKAHLRSVYWRDKVKQGVQRKHDLGVHEDKIEAELTKWRKTHGVVISGNKVEGGTARQRLRAALLRAMLNYQHGKQPGYYSQSGAERLYGKMLEGMPYGHIFDCSTFADGIYFCCGLKDPSATDYHEGYTGTEGAHGKEVPAALAKVGDLVLYGSFPHHHVEVVLDPERQTTCGHGSPPIDEGVFDLFGDSDFVIRTYL